MYGFKLTQAGRAVLELFGQRNFVVVVESYFLAVVLSITEVAIRLVCAYIGALLVMYTDLVILNHKIYFLSIMGFCIDTGVANTPLSVLNCAVSAVIVCYAEDPATFAVAHPELYATLVTEWYKHHRALC